jgi:hypothetical protein
MAYDAIRSEVVLFGGEANSGTLGDTWIWNGSTWTQRFPATTPSQAWRHAMAFDIARGQTVMFGFDGTWVWDGTDWAQKNPATSPAPRQQSAMVYDAGHAQIVLFGGQSVLLGNPILNDTWVWDGANWTQKFPITSPPARNWHAMAYDAARQQVVLFGGGTSSNYSDQTLGDTWVWDGTNWTQKFPSLSPPDRWQHAMAYDATAGRVVLFAGFRNNVGYLADTWIWDGNNWIQESPTTIPQARSVHAMAYDAGRNQVVLFGGLTPFSGYVGHTWLFVGP